MPTALPLALHLDFAEHPCPGGSLSIEPHGEVWDVHALWPLDLHG